MPCIPECTWMKPSPASKGDDPSPLHAGPDRRTTFIVGLASRVIGHSRRGSGFAVFREFHSPYGDECVIGRNQHGCKGQVTMRCVVARNVHGDVITRPEQLFRHADCAYHAGVLKHHRHWAGITRFGQHRECVAGLVPCREQSERFRVGCHQDGRKGLSLREIRDLHFVVGDGNDRATADDHDGQECCKDISTHRVLPSSVVLTCHVSMSTDDASGCFPR